MSTELRQRYLDTYKPLVADFLADIRGIDCKRMPQLCLPVCGECYHTATTKFAFIGIDCPNSGGSEERDLTYFINRFQADPDGALRANLDDFSGGDLWIKHEAGKAFWNFVFKFLSHFHGTHSWRELRDDNANSDERLQEFIYNNMNAIDGYATTAKKRNVSPETWCAVKEASQRFDRAKYILDVFRPDVMIILNWLGDEAWLTEGLSDVQTEKLGERLWYYFIQSSKTHVFWRDHPRYRKEASDTKIAALAQTVKDRLSR